MVFFLVNGMADGEPRKSGGEGIGVCPKHFVPWVLNPVVGKFGVIVEGECHFFFSDQGPLLKGGGDVGRKYPGERAFEIFFVCLEVEMSLRVMRPTSSDAKLMGGGLMWPCRPLHFALSKAFCSK
jgi:hypothetical protein